MRQATSTPWTHPNPAEVADASLRSGTGAGALDAPPKRSPIACWREAECDRPRESPVSAQRGSAVPGPERLVATAKEVLDAGTIESAAKENSTAYRRPQRRSLVGRTQGLRCLHGRIRMHAMSGKPGALRRRAMRLDGLRAASRSLATVRIDRDGHRTATRYPRRGVGRGPGR